MDRLTNGIEYCKLHCDIGKSNKCFFSDKDKCYERSIYNRLKEYEDLEERGLMFRVLCKVGDIIYSINHNEKHEVTPVIVVEIKFSATGVTNKPYIKIICSDSDLRTKGCKEYDGDDFGKTIFLTKSEAEQKLKEMEG